MRAVCFYSFGGDDNEQHTKISNCVPDDFPERELRANELKDARLRRNEADYDPYPEDEAAFRTTALGLAKTANHFVAECRAYLTGKGIAYL